MRPYPEQSQPDHRVCLRLHHVDRWGIFAEDQVAEAKKDRPFAESECGSLNPDGAGVQHPGNCFIGEL